MHVYSFILTVLSVIYVFQGFQVIRLDPRSKLNRLFFTLIISLVVWSLASAFYIDAHELATCVFWYKLSCIGFNAFLGIVLHFFLVYVKREHFLRRWWAYAVLYLPGVVLSYMETVYDTYVESYTLGSNGWIINAKTESVWFWAAIAYSVVYVLAVIVMLIRYRKTVNSPRERSQAKVMIVTAVISLLAGLIIMALTSIAKLNIPDATPIASAIWAYGIFFSIVKFKMMAMTPSFVAENLFQTIIDSVILTNPEGKIVNVNPETLALLGYSREELIGKPLEYLFYSEDPSHAEGIANLLSACPIRSVETSMLSKSGAKIPIMLSVSECTDDFGTRIGYVLASKDITEYKHAKERIQYLATHDSLTGLPNRMLFIQLLSHSIESAKRNQRQLAVFFVDLDRFKTINDTKGHDAGDKLLQEIASRYKQVLRAADVVSRQGGDEFVILIEDFHKLIDLERVAQHILSCTYRPVVLQGDEYRVTASIGISLYPKNGSDGQTLMKNADTAMYYAKGKGKNNYQFYSENIHLQSAGRMDIERELRSALERNEFSLHYQAKVDVKTNAIIGVEALLRWQNPTLGSVPPTQFIPVAEETGAIIPIGRWVLKTACAQNAAWQKQGLPAICMAVNLSVGQTEDSHLIGDIKAALKDNSLAPHLLELEITESMLMSNPPRMIAALAKIKKLGVRLSIDDFGTGYSSLAKLRHFPVDTLKIDRSFIRNIPENAEDKAITQAIIVMGESLGLTVIAEGVETEEQLKFLKDQACDEIQGYLFSKPTDADRFADLLRKQAGASPAPQG